MNTSQAELVRLGKQISVLRKEIDKATKEGNNQKVLVLEGDLYRLFCYYGALAYALNEE